MSPLLFFITVLLVALTNHFIGYRIGYYEGKKEVSHILRGEPPDDMEDEIEHFKAFRADTAERQGGPISR